MTAGACLENRYSKDFPLVAAPNSANCEQDCIIIDSRGESPPDAAFGDSGLPEPRGSHVSPVCVLCQLSNRISCVYEYKHCCLTHSELVNSVMVSAVIDRLSKSGRTLLLLLQLEADSISTGQR